MANVTFEGEAFKDPRFAVLGALLGTSKFDARGRMLEVWSYCTEECTYFVRPEVLDALMEKVGACGLVESAGLAERTDEGHFRVLGTRGRVEWLKRLKKIAKKGGDANKKRLAKRKASQPDSQEANQEDTQQASPPTLIPDSSPEGLSGERRREEQPAGSQAPLKLEPSKPKPKSPVAQLQERFVPWYAERYQGAIYAWGKAEAGKASQLLKRAGAGGVAEIMRRARIAGGQGWRQGAVSLGTLLGAWNDLAIGPAPTATASRPTYDRPAAGGMSEQELDRLERDARRFGLVDDKGNPA